MPLQLLVPQAQAILALADGTVFQGISIGAPGRTVGEVVFNTAMTGYQEILTDPSYCQQIVTLTYPHIGNYGVSREDVEASKVHAAGLVIRDLPVLASNFRMTQTLQEYLQREGTVAIANVDTRRLTRLLRSGGAQNGCILSLPLGRAVGRGGARRGHRRSAPCPQHVRTGPGEGRQREGSVRVARDGMGTRNGLRQARRTPFRGRGVRLRHQAQHPADAGEPGLRG